MKLLKFVSRNYVLIDLLQLIAAVITVVTGVIVLYQAFIKKDISVIIGAIIAFVFFIMLGGLVLKFWNMAVNRYEGYAYAFHKFNYTLRNETYKLERLKKEGRLNLDLLTKSLEETGQHTVNILEDILSRVTNRPISVHIKYFPITAKDKNAFRTLCISTKSDTARLTVTDHPIAENTHFRSIVENEKDIFFAPDLEHYIQEYEKESKDPFKITAKHWKKWFRSIMVVPIRINQNVKDGTDDTKYDYLGFIVCDAKDSDAFRNNELTGHVNMVWAFADGIFTYLDTVANYSQELNQMNYEGKRS